MIHTTISSYQDICNQDIQPADTGTQHDSTRGTHQLNVLLIKYLKYSGEPKETEEIHSWLMLTDEKTFIYICTSANIFSCLINLRPV